MKLLIVTRKVDTNDERIGFFIDWIAKIAERVEELKVICLEMGDASGLPGNVEIFSMGKEAGYSRLRKYFRYRKFLKELLPQVDGVFIHMIPLYANIAGPLVKNHKKKMYLWYTHKTVDHSLKKSEKWVDGYLTASPQSFKMPTLKPVIVMNHGINVEKFRVNERYEKKNDPLHLLTVGRITPAKDLDTLLAAAKALKAKGQAFSWDVIGAPSLPSDEVYLSGLKRKMEENGLQTRINFLGAMPHAKVIKKYTEVDMFVNFSDAAFDKTMLEAMAAGLLVFTPNEAFRETLGEYANMLMFKLKDAQDLVSRLLAVKAKPLAELSDITKALRHKIESRHNLDKLADKIVLLYK